MYRDGMAEAYRVLKHKGILIIKCMDQVQSGRQQWAHLIYHQMAEKLGFRAEDLFVLVRKSRPLMRHKPENQKHARRNHSYFQIFRAWKR
jgi:DNA modification methylase